MRTSLSDTEPDKFIADFFESFTQDLLSTDGDAGPVVDRYHTPDVVEFADGIRIDRAGLVAHARPVRKNRPTLRVEVHECVADGDRLAARYTLHATQRGRNISTEVYFFGQFAADGRMRRAHMTTRTVAEQEATS
ncbi:nuclear transport factor 2 family protein [Streptomyces beihaiensis]|uniref:Nuclear transport factor 2 family protein n=1 Tax=Streptomyces beihaiensis TaxID=2984495 RepID=A0ABT3TQ66_9ACTN|nr:nuclear transport factor 2 family protein [Streptomyces beihaiensis]MCX3059179.1 nuclear transport factor 2 family protein [Streptomyces beihaiensis]